MLYYKEECKETCNRYIIPYTFYFGNFFKSLVYVKYNITHGCKTFPKKNHK